MRRQHHVLGRLLRAADLRHHVEDRHLTQRLGLRLHSEHRVLPILRETKDEPVVLAAQIDRRDLLVEARVEDAIDPPAAGPRVVENAARSRRAQKRRNHAQRRAGRRVAGRPHETLVPRRRHPLPVRAHPRERRRVGEPLPVVVGTAGGLRHGEEHELAAGLRQPRLELRAAVHIRKNRDTRLDRCAARRARTPGEHHRLERTDARLDQVDVRDPSTPPAPRAVLLRARADPPRAVSRDRPIIRRSLSGCARQPRPDRIEQRLRQRMGLGAVHPDRPDAT